MKHTELEPLQAALTSEADPESAPAANGAGPDTELQGEVNDSFLGSIGALELDQSVRPTSHPEGAWDSRLTLKFHPEGAGDTERLEGSRAGQHGPSQKPLSSRTQLLLGQRAASS